MTVTASGYGREGEKAFKYTDIVDAEVDADRLAGDLVGHWLTHEGWEERDELYHDGSTFFRGLRDGKELRIKHQEDVLRIEYGLETMEDYSRHYVESVWQDEIRAVLERHMDDVKDFHIEKKTWENLYNNPERHND
ncbi:MAG: hypothetical protein ABEJ95_04560 [Candidatus Nanohalobium sp.]